MGELAVGQVVDGRYELEAVIGKGGMGCVYRARHVITHGRVALKVMTDTMDADAVQRFLAEARAASTIGHPAIVEVSDANRLPDGQLYLVMELLAGKPLRIAMHGGLPGDQIRRIGLELLDALGAAHARGIIHRDLKPENIWLVAGTTAVKVLDFGIAKVMGSSSITHHGHVLGTLEYMAPEQLTDAAQVDGRADLWAVGVILYEMIAGVRPYGGTTREARYAALASEEPTPIGEVALVSPQVEGFFATALARDPARRFATAAAMMGALRQLSFTQQPAISTAPGAGSTLGTGAGWQQPGAGSTLGTGAGRQQPGAGSTLGTGAGRQQPGAGSTLGTGTGWQQPGEPRPPPGSIPPANDVPGAPPPAPPQVIPSTNVATRGRPTLWIALGLVVVGGAIAFGVVMATRQPAISQAHQPTPDAEVIVATPADAETGLPAICKNVCAKLTACKLALSTCEHDCISNAIPHVCLDAVRTCDDLASCIISTRCYAPPTGTAGCGSAVQCENMTAINGPAAVCENCLTKMKLSSATKYLAFHACRKNLGNDVSKGHIVCRDAFDDCLGDK